tara:strand:+ start:9246 stop:9563 length:318 start_codon:yes stop_codon:yes gene_type:complete
MKVITIFLSILILGLSAAPCCIDEEICHEEVSCTDDATQSSENDSPELPCLPFFSCGSCTGFSLLNLEFSNLSSQFYEQPDFSASYFLGAPQIYSPSLLKPPKQI